MTRKKKIMSKDDVTKPKKKKKILPRKNAETSSPTPGSMSEGNLSNRRFGRYKSRTPRRKLFITGTDDDGQT
ncbi:MAG TPA: hypothetical protein PKC72_00435 [Chitinophagaceae bacterium]|nr:hypothetical protein [Chitinophagaceae bacterium]